LQQTDVKVRATLNKGLLQVVIVSNQVPKQDSSVEFIPKLVKDFNSNLIEKLKVIGMREIADPTNSSIYWVEESIIVKQPVQKVNNKDISLRQNEKSGKIKIEQINQTSSFEKFYFKIIPLLRYTTIFAISLLIVYLSLTIIDCQNKIKQLELSLISTKKYYNNKKPLDAASFEEIITNNNKYLKENATSSTYIIEIVTAESVKEDQQSTKEYLFKRDLNTFIILIFFCVLLISIYMEIRLISNARKLKLTYRKEYYSLKEKLRKDPNNNTLRGKMLETARLAGYDEQTIANDLSIIN
jgi:hypothetical protein